MTRKLLFITLATSFPLAIAAAPVKPAVGSIPGAFQVTLAGSATYQIPIRVAPGTAGMQPSVALSYDSQARGGPLGAGWAISGLSVITRGPKDARLDGLPDGVRMAETDALYLDGQRLIGVRTEGTGTDRLIEYRKQNDDQTQVIEKGADFATARFLVKTKGGLTIVFDSVPGAPADQNRGDIRFSDGSVLLRAESRLLDSAGNFIDFYYLVNGNGNYDVKSIRYTGHVATSDTAEQPPYASVEFKYETAPRSLQNFVAGHSLIVDTRLTGILARVASKADDVANASWLQVARYSFEYDDRETANRFVLKTIHQFGEDDSELRPTLFSYSAPAIGWADAAYSYPAVLATHEEIAAGYRFAHVSTSPKALPDLLYAAQDNGQLESFSFQNNGNSWSSLDSFKSPIPFANEDGKDLGVILVDINGDGRSDLLQAYQIGSQVPVRASYTTGATGWDKQSAFELPFVVSKDGVVVAKYRLETWTGGKGPDLLFQSGSQRGFLANAGSGWKVDNRYLPPFDLANPTWTVDIDCSGKPSLIGAIKDVTGSTSWKVFKFGAQSWEEIASPAFQPPFPADVDPDAIRVIKVDGTSCPAILVATANKGGVHGVFQASSTGWRPIVSKIPAFDLVDSKGESAYAVVAEIAGGGLSDVFANRISADGHITKFMYFQTGTGWQSAPAQFQIPTLSRATGAASIYYTVADFNGDGKSDIAVAANSRQSFGQVFLAANSGFVNAPDYLPPVAFAQKNHQDQGVRMVDLNGDGLIDVLVSRAGTGSPAAWINTASGWTSQPGLIPPCPSRVMTSLAIQFNFSTWMGMDLLTCSIPTRGPPVL